MNFQDVTEVKINGKDIARIDFQNTTLWEKPSGYTELDYIEGTGTQYITTGVALLNNNAWTIELDVQFTDVNYNYNGIWGLTSGVTKYEAWIAKNGYSYARYNGRKPASITLNTNRMLYRDYYNASTDIFNTYINNVNVRAYNPGPAPVSDNLNIMRCSGANMKGKLYGAKLYIGNRETLVRDFIPVLDNHNVPCLYDKISETYFYNVGTGTFSYGLKGA